LKLDRINLLKNYLDEGKLHFEKDGLGNTLYLRCSLRLSKNVLFFLFHR
jgi:hypothetical protein